MNRPPPTQIKMPPSLPPFRHPVTDDLMTASFHFTHRRWHYPTYPYPPTRYTALLLPRLPYRSGLCFPYPATNVFHLAPSHFAVIMTLYVAPSCWAGFSPYQLRSPPPQDLTSLRKRLEWGMGGAPLTHLASYSSYRCICARTVVGTRC